MYICSRTWKLGLSKYLCEEIDRKQALITNWALVMSEHLNVCMMQLFGPILDDGLKEKFMKPWKHVHPAHAQADSFPLSEHSVKLWKVGRATHFSFPRVDSFGDTCRMLFMTIFLLENWAAATFSVRNANSAGSFRSSCHFLGMMFGPATFLLIPCPSSHMHFLSSEIFYPYDFHSVGTFNLVSDVRQENIIGLILERWDSSSWNKEQNCSAI